MTTIQDKWLVVGFGSDADYGVVMFDQSGEPCEVKWLGSLTTTPWTYADLRDADVWCDSREHARAEAALRMAAKQ